LRPPKQPKGSSRHQTGETFDANRIQEKIMKLKIFLTVFCTLFLTFAGLAQEPVKPPVQTETKFTAKDYQDLAAKLKAGDTNVDYKSLRMAFAETEEYSYSGPDKAEREKYFKPFNDKKYKEALKQAEKFLEKNYVDANAHYVVYNSAKELKDDKKAEFHKTVLLGLLNSIKSGNDGLSEKTPFYVITIDEEYTLLNFLGYQRGGQALRHSEGHTFDVLTATNSKTGEKVTLFFNIDVVWAAEMKIFGK
jgi:hypothetical protein